jgi:RNA polymerase sigma-70 factor, ECF subfamily
VVVNKARFFSSPAQLDERAFETIFNEHYAKVYSVLFRLTGDPDEADDLTAETFWRLWQRPPADGDNLGGWLYRVALNLGYNHLRANQRRDHYQAQASPETWESQSSPDPAQEAERHMEREHVRSVLRQLALRDVQVLVLRHSGLSYKEIAAALDIAAGSVGTILSRAETRFEEQYRKGEKDASKR